MSRITNLLKGIFACPKKYTYYLIFLKSRYNENEDLPSMCVSGNIFCDFNEACAYYKYLKDNNKTWEPVGLETLKSSEKYTCVRCVYPASPEDKFSLVDVEPQ